MTPAGTNIRLLLESTHGTSEAGQHHVATSAMAHRRGPRDDQPDRGGTSRDVRLRPNIGKATQRTGWLVNDDACDGTTWSSGPTRFFVAPCCLF